MAVPPPPLKAMLLPETYPRIIHSHLVGFPITGLLGTAPRAVATHNLLQWFLDRPDIRPRHASIAPFVCRVILAVGHQVFRLIRIVLEKGNGPDTVHTCGEGNDHRSSLGVADQSGAHLIPAAYGSDFGDATIIGGAKPHLTARALADALSQRRAAVLRERGRIEHAVRDFLALLPCCDAKTDHIGVDLDADIGLARLHAVPFAVANHATARQHAAIGLEIVLHNRPPSNRER